MGVCAVVGSVEGGVGGEGEGYPLRGLAGGLDFAVEVQVDEFGGCGVVNEPVEGVAEEVDGVG